MHTGVSYLLGPFGIVLGNWGPAPEAISIYCGVITSFRYIGRSSLRWPWNALLLEDSRYSIDSLVPATQHYQGPFL